MRPWILRILLCLTLGVITTVATAWGIAYFFAWDMPRGDEAVVALYAEERPPHRVQVCRWERVGSTTVFVVKGSPLDGTSYNDLSQTVPSWCCSDVDARREEALGAFRQVWTSFEARGWPMVAMSAEQHGGFAGLAAPRMSTIHGIRTNRPRVNPITNPNFQHARLLPTRVIWPGFLINTLFYAAIWFGVFFAPGMVRRAIRRRRGCCVQCGYDLRGQREVVSHQSSAVGQIDGRSPHAGPLPPPPPDTPPPPPPPPDTDTGEGEGIRCPECGWGRVGGR